MDILSGIVERITFINEETGFSVIKIKSKGFSDLVTVVGNMASVNVGSSISLKGEWKHDSKYGKQFSVSYYSETIPATVAGIEKYLGSGFIKGIGPVFAKRIVNNFKDDTLRIIEEDPDRLVEVGGVGPKRVEMIKKAWVEQKEIKNVMLFLQSHGVSPAYAVKIYKRYGNNSIKIVQDNPYRLADDIWGIGFKTADKIAQKLGYDKDSYERCRSGIAYTLSELSNDGHCFATQEQLVKEAIGILEVTEENIRATMDKMLAEKSIIRDENAIYLPPFYHSELGVAQRIKEILANNNPYATEKIDEVINSLQIESKIKYDNVQIEAIKTAVASKFMVLTGGPGTGKTTSILAIIKVFEKLKANVLLAAPTGRAAKKMAETTGMEAKTIHRLLEYRPPEGNKRNSENPLKCDVLIIDETSMIDVILMYNLLKAVSNNTVVVLVGDVDQLPSVGAGNVLRDIIDSGTVSLVRLTKIFRQAQGSMIITNAHRINKGEFPIIKRNKENDFFFIQEEEPEKIIGQVKELCAKRLPGYYKVDPINDIQVLCPMIRGDLGAANFNRVLQETLNNMDISIKYGGTEFKLNDKVMQIKNNYDKNVFNGDIGRISQIDQEDKTVVINFDDHEVEYDITELDEVTLAYATTVHKSQGSEYKIVVAPIVTQHFMMLQRNLLYTCVTRAKEILVLIGSTKAVAIAVKNNKIIKRNTMLSKRLAVS